MTGPLVSVVMATYGRGRHILPSIRSVLGQRLTGWELLVVGDGCTDETGAVVGAVDDPRVRWLNLADRVGSQSGPNNAGVAAAHGALIAYLGHDDIWEPDHLERLVALFQRDPGLDFGVSGGIFHLPNGMPGSHVTGLFAEGEDIGSYFFPPSSFAHRKTALDRVGLWRLPMECCAPVDEDLLLRAEAAGLTFRSTGAVTLHKFAAGHRYLSYLQPDSHEQEAMLADLALPGHAERIAAVVEAARQSGSYMTKHDRDFSRFKPGELYRQSIERRGAREVSTVPLGQGIVIRQPVEAGSLDWKAGLRLGFRRNRLNPRPRLLVPVTGGRARLRFTAACRVASALGPLALECNGEPLVARPGRRWFGLIAWFTRYEVEIALRPEGPTVLELCLSEVQRPIRRRRRLAVGSLHLQPI